MLQGGREIKCPLDYVCKGYAPCVKRNPCPGEPNYRSLQVGVNNGVTSAGGLRRGWHGTCRLCWPAWQGRAALVRTSITCPQMPARLVPCLQTSGTAPTAPASPTSRASTTATIAWVRGRPSADLSAAALLLLYVCTLACLRERLAARQPGSPQLSPSTGTNVSHNVPLGPAQSDLHPCFPARRRCLMHPAPLAQLPLLQQFYPLLASFLPFNSFPIQAAAA